MTRCLSHATSSWSGLRALWILPALLLACADGRRRAADTGGKGGAERAGPRWDVAYAGCAVVREGPVCQLGAERTLVVWTRGPGDTPAIETDAGPALLSGRTPIDGGVRFSAKIPASARELTVGSTAGQPGWRLALADAPVFAVIDKARALRAQGKAGEWPALVKSARDGLPPEGQALADGLLARDAMAHSRLEEAETLFARSMDGARATGRISDYVNDGFAQFWALVALQQRFAEARALLQRLEPVARTYPEGAVHAAYNEAMLANEEGDYRTALDRLRTAREMAGRLAVERVIRAADTERSIVLANLGRAGEAVALLRARATASAAPCDAATSHINLAWALTREEVDSGGANAQEIDRAFADASAAAKLCGDGFHRRMLALNRAERAIHAGQLNEARHLLKENAGAAAGTETDRLIEWESELHGRLALAEGRAGPARTHFERARELAQAAGRESSALLAEVGIGRALIALGKRAAGITSLAAAQRRVERLMAAIPLGEGQTRFAAIHDQGIRSLVDALVASGDAGAAFAAARRTRAQVLARANRIDRLMTLDAGTRARWEAAIGRYRRLRAELEKDAAGDWALSRAALEQAQRVRQAKLDESRTALDEAYGVLGAGGEERRLPQPGDGELYLGYFPSERGWIAFAATPARVRSLAIADVDVALDAAVQGARLLEPFSAEIANARRVRFLAYGAADRLDLHALPWRGRPLVAAREVEYGIDLGHTAAARALPAAPTAGAALIVADPGGDLPNARAEAASVARVLAAVSPRVLLGAEATRERTLALLAQARIFHFAGHARTEGSEGMESSLSVASGAELTPGDLLALPSVPETVVLSACEAASTPDQGPLRWGVAQSFLAAGSQVVVAPVRRVQDGVARAFSAAFHEALAPDTARPAAAFRKAVASVAPKASPREWAAFRLFVP